MKNLNEFQLRNVLDVVGQGFSGRFDEESDDGQMLFDVGPFDGFLVRSLGANGFQEIRQSGETAARI
jgi:hypothetical protein